MATVRSNDRIFSCTLETCDGGSDFRRFSSSNRHGGSISIRACFLDVEKLRESLYYALNHVGNELIQLRAWLYEREQEYELKFLASGGAASTDQTTFNKVNVTLSRLRRQVDQLGRWYGDFQDQVAYALDTLGSYSETASVLRNFAPNESTGGLPPNPIVLARRNITRAKAIQRQTNNLARTESRLNTTIASIQRQLDSFSSGIVRFRGRVINIPELATLIGQLSNDGSPLERVQLMIANASNSLKQVYSVGTESRSPSIHVPETAQFKQLLPGSDASMEELLEYLRTLSVSTLYTDNTKSPLEGAITYVRDRALKDRVAVRDQNGVPTGATQPNPSTLAAVDRYASRIRASLPGRVIEKYRAAVRDREGIYLRLNRLHELIGNVQPGDEIYKRELQDIYDETYDVLETELSGNGGEGNFEDGGGDGRGGNSGGSRRRRDGGNDDPDDDGEGGAGAGGRKATKRKRRTIAAAKRSTRSGANAPASTPNDTFGLQISQAAITMPQSQSAAPPQFPSPSPQQFPSPQLATGQQFQLAPEQPPANTARPQITSYVTIQPGDGLRANQAVDPFESVAATTYENGSASAAANVTASSTAFSTGQNIPQQVTSQALNSTTNVTYPSSNSVTYQPVTEIPYLPTNVVTYQQSFNGNQLTVGSGYQQGNGSMVQPNAIQMSTENRIASPPKQGSSAFVSFSREPVSRQPLQTAPSNERPDVTAEDGTIFMQNV